MCQISKMQEALANIPFAIRDAAKTQKELRKTILREIHKETSFPKAEVLDFLNKETEYKLTKEEYNG